MTTADSTGDDALHEAYLAAAKAMADGASVQEMRILLMGKGFTHADATSIIEELEEARSEVAKEPANEMISYGAFWFVGGILVTAMTYNAAAAYGGSYIVAVGAILYGATLLIQGYSELKN